MSQQPSRRTTRQVRQLFGQLYDKAAGIAESLQPCGCGAGAPAQDGQDVNAMAQDLLAIRQRAGGCICGPPCDGTSVDNPSDETLQTMLARLEWDASVLDDNLVPCGCPEEPEDVEESVEEIVRTPLTLMTLPPEVRDLIWWQVLEPPAPMSPVDSQWFVRIVQRWIAPNENGLDFPFHNRHYSINRGYAPPWRLTFQHANSQRDLEDIRNRWAVLGVNRQVYQEAEAEFWRRTLRDGHMLSFTSDPNYAGSDYYGILTAWTFFNNYRGLYLEQIRRVQISMELPSANDFRGVGVRGQALVSIRRPLGNSNGGEYLIPLIDLMANELPNLQHLSLTFGGFVPDMRVQPWLEGRRYQDTPPQSSVPWVRRLQTIRGLTRLRLRVVFAPENTIGFAPGRAVTRNHPLALRVVHFLSTLRASMLVNGAALGDRHIQRWVVVRYNGHTVLIIQCDDEWDDEWDEGRGRHIHYSREDGQGTYDDGAGIN